MIAETPPLAIGIGEGGAQSAPLGRAVIGGLAAATIATLVILPAIYTLLQVGRTRESASLLPDDRPSSGALSDYHEDQIAR